MSEHKGPPGYVPLTIHELNGTSPNSRNGGGRQGSSNGGHDRSNRSGGGGGSNGYSRGSGGGGGGGQKNNSGRKKFPRRGDRDGGFDARPERGNEGGRPPRGDRRNDEFSGNGQPDKEPVGAPKVDMSEDFGGDEE